MRLSFANVFRLIVLLALTAHVFYMYSLARANAETFGFNLGTTVVAALFALAMLVPLVWAVTLPELPEIYVSHIRARRWWKQNRCPQCGYSRAGLDEVTCPECGCEISPPREYAVNTRTIAMFIALNLMAWSIGCATAEALWNADEATFMREAKAHELQGFANYCREARWPSHGLLIWDEGGAHHARGGTQSVGPGRITR